MEPHEKRERFGNLPPRIRALPRDHRGYPIPFFVETVDGKPDFRVMSPERYKAAVTRGLCWTCGQKLGRNLAFVGGPLVALQGVSEEPPSHLECAEVGARICPFLTKPQSKRRLAGLPEALSVPSKAQIEDNPGVTVIVVCRQTRRDGMLFEFLGPTGLHWFHQGRAASREEVLAAGQASIEQFRQLTGEAGVHHAIRLENRLVAMLPSIASESACEGREDGTMPFKP